MLVLLRTVVDSAQRTWLRFEVHDTGIGVDESRQAHLFEPFTQADGSTTRRFGGTGLGLTVNRRLVELMGGRIGLKSVADQGSLFWFSIPLKEAPNAPASPIVEPVDLDVFVFDKN